MYRCFLSRLTPLRSLVRYRSTATTTETELSIHKIPLSDPVPGLPDAKYTVPADLSRSPRRGEEEKTSITVLENGLRIASQPQLGQFCTVGVCIDSGSRYEVAYPSGVSHFIQKLAFGASENFPDREAVQQQLEKYGGICDCQSTRDTFLYASSIDIKGLEAAVDIISDAVLRPKLKEDEIEYARTVLKFELEDLSMRPDQEPILLEMIHAAAFSNNTIGLPNHCPIENVATMNRETLVNFLGNYHIPERMVLAGVGVDHEELVNLGKKYFVEKEPAFKLKNTHVDKSKAQYTGGIQTEERDLSNVSLGPTPMPELAHLTIGLEAVSHQHEDFIAYCVLNMMMGGGGSFSAGGPGKGMYTRLYTHVLNRYHWMYSCQAFNHAYADAGLFCINASAHPTQLSDLTQVVVREFVALTGDISDEELNRAKKQLTSMLLMNLESRPVIFEDVARQVLAQGNRKQPEDLIHMIGKVTTKDINRIAARMLASKPAVAAVGSLAQLPSYHDIELGLLDKKSSQKKSSFSFFR